MATVYLAHDLKHDRPVALKVLRPELAAPLGAERFLREIRLCARLQHPLIPSIHDSGESAGRLWFTMPYVEGESLRERLRRENELPVEDALRIAGEVADALDYAHRHGVVHRDIKPENILLTGSHALVADFGVARALDAAGGEKLTETGLALGTVHYMSPEQASGGSVDGRSDIYSLGCVLYEMLAGEPPFTGHTPQAVIAKRFVQPVLPLRQIRPAVPAWVDSAVTRALAQVPADRFSAAGEFAHALNAVSAAGAVPGQAAGAEPQVRQRPVPTAAAALALYLVCSLLVLGAVHLLTATLGLPDWVTPVAVVLLAIGLPIILATAVVQHRHSPSALSEPRAESPESSHWLTWRWALSGGVLAFAALGVAVAVYMALRALGLGPVGTLLAAGVLRDRERLLLADFQSRTRDTLLSSAVTEAFRIDFAQSPVVRVVPPEQVAEVLERMRHPPTARLDLALAREVAAREGIRAIVTGEIAAAGSRYLLSARLLSAAGGEVLAAHRETARDSTQIVPALDRLSRRLRAKIGESLKALRAEPPLEHVTSGSLEALRKYTQAIRAGDFGGDHAKAIPLLEEAVALDTGFATAYRTLGVYLGFMGERQRQVEALTKAFRHADRQTDLERDHTRALYYSMVTYELDKAAAAYRAALERHPADSLALNNLAGIYGQLRQPARAEELLRRVIALDSGATLAYLGLTGVLADLGRRAEAELTYGIAAGRFSDNPTVEWFGVLLASSKGDYRTAETRAQAFKERHGESPAYRALASDALADLALVGGKLAAAEVHLREEMSANAEGGAADGYLDGAVSLGFLDVWFRHQPARGLEKVAKALTRYPLDSLDALDRPYLSLAFFYALAGEPQRARALLTEYERVVEPALRRGSEPWRRWAWGYVATAEGQLSDALAHFEEYTRTAGGCRICGLAEMGRTYDRLDQPDSAFAYYQRYVTAPGLFRLAEDGSELAGIYKRLGELYEARGDRAKAREYYGRFADLWSECDPELRPAMTEVRRRLAQLSQEPSS